MIEDMTMPIKDLKSWDINPVTIECETHGKALRYECQVYGEKIGIFCFRCMVELLSKNIKNYAEELK